MIDKTDIKFAQLAMAVAGIFSKDPSTRVGAVVVGASANQVAFGYNGFPPGVADTAARLEDRSTKLQLTLHAEENALINAPFNVRTVYVTHHPCQHCVLRILAERTVRRVVYLKNPEFEARWADSLDVARDLLHEGGVTLEGVEL